MCLARFIVIVVKSVLNKILSSLKESVFSPWACSILFKWLKQISRWALAASPWMTCRPFLRHLSILHFYSPLEVIARQKPNGFRPLHHVIILSTIYILTVGVSAKGQLKVKPWQGISNFTWPWLLPRESLEGIWGLIYCLDAYMRFLGGWVMDKEIES